jgi:hypothetical protein
MEERFNFIFSHAADTSTVGGLFTVQRQRTERGAVMYGAWSTYFFSDE